MMSHESIGPETPQRGALCSPSEKIGGPDGGAIRMFACVMEYWSIEKNTLLPHPLLNAEARPEVTHSFPCGRRLGSNILRRFGRGNGWEHVNVWSLFPVPDLAGSKLAAPPFITSLTFNVRTAFWAGYTRRIGIELGRQTWVTVKRPRNCLRAPSVVAVRQEPTKWPGGGDEAKRMLGERRQNMGGACGRKRWRRNCGCEVTRGGWHGI